MISLSNILQCLAMAKGRGGSASAGPQLSLYMGEEIKINSLPFPSNEHHNHRRRAQSPQEKPLEKRGRKIDGGRRQRAKGYGER